MSVQPLFKKFTTKKLPSSTNKITEIRGVEEFQGFQAILPSLCHIQGEKAQQLIKNRPGVSKLVGIMKDKLISFKHL